MSKSNTNIIIIDDEPQLQDHPLIIELQQCFEDIKIFSNPNDGVFFIEKHLIERNIVILDYRFDNFKNGSQILASIREVSKAIPVILWTANADRINEIINIVNNNIFEIHPKSPYQPLLESIKRAENEIEVSIEGALEEWISYQNNENAPYIITANGKDYSLNDLLKEIRMQTSFGLKIQKDILMLTVDLLIRNKKHLND